MTELGVFAVDRGIFDHPLLADRAAFSRREAWLWLIAEAAWKDRPVSRSGQVVTLKRGQLAHSVRFIAEAWGWPKSNVERFLTKLKTGTMVTVQNETGFNVITICNYDAYQRVSLPDRDSDNVVERDASGTAAGQQRDKLEDIQGIQPKVLSETGVSDPVAKKAARKTYPAEFDAIWRKYPGAVGGNMSKPKALDAWKKLDADDRAKVDASLAGFSAYCKSKPDYTPVHLVRFITERRFDNYIGAERAKSATPEDWQKRLQYGREHRKWSDTEWGPAPGARGCLVPSELIQPGDGDGWAKWKRAG